MEVGVNQQSTTEELQSLKAGGRRGKLLNFVAGGIFQIAAWRKRIPTESDSHTALSQCGEDIFPTYWERQKWKLGLPNWWDLRWGQVQQRRKLQRRNPRNLRRNSSHLLTMNLHIHMATRLPLQKRPGENRNGEVEAAGITCYWRDRGWSSRWKDFAKHCTFIWDPVGPDARSKTQNRTLTKPKIKPQQNQVSVWYLDCQNRPYNSLLL